MDSLLDIRPCVMRCYKINIDIRVAKISFGGILQVGLFSGTMFIVGSMIGSGIFISPKGILRQTNSVGMSLVVWALCGVVATFGKKDIIQENDNKCLRYITHDSVSYQF